MGFNDMTLRYAKLTSYLPFLSVILFHALIIYPQFITPGEILRMSDFILPNVNNQTNFDLSFYAWTTYGLGQPSIPSFSTGLIYILSRVFGTPFAQQFLGFAPFLVASAGMYFFLVRTGWMKSRPWAAVTAILYFVNWPVFSYVGDNGILLTLTGLMWTYAMIPFSMLYANKIFIDDEFSTCNVICLALCSWVALLWNSQAFVMMGVILIPFIIHYVCEKIIGSSTTKRTAINRLIFALAGWAGLCLLLAFPVVMVLLGSVVSSGNVQSLYGAKAVLGPSSAMFSFMYPYIISPFTLLSNPRPSQNFIEILGLCVPVLSIFGILWEKDRRKKLMALLLLAFVFLVACWTRLIITHEDFVARIYAIPLLGQLLQVVRSPYKFFIFLGPALIVLLGLGIDNVTKKLSSRFGALMRAALIVCAVLAVFLNHKGRIFHLRATYVDAGITLSGQGGSHALPYGRLNKSLLEITKELQNRGGPHGRILWLPNENDIWLQTTQISFENVLSYPSTLTMAYFQKEIASCFTDGTISRLAKILSLLRIRYVVIIKYAKQSGPPRIWGTPPWGEHIVGDPMAFLSSLEEQNGLAKLREDASYVIYENKLFH